MKQVALKYLPPGYANSVGMKYAETVDGVGWLRGPCLPPTRYGNSRMLVWQGTLYMELVALNEVDKDRAAALAGVEFSIAPLKADNTTDPGGAFLLPEVSHVQRPPARSEAHPAVRPASAP